MRKTHNSGTKPKIGATVVIPPEHESLLSEVHDAVKAMSRHSADQAFDKGYQFARAKAVLPEKMFGRWMSTVCGYTPRQGRNYVAIHEHLQEYRPRLVAAAVVPTIMFVLASAKSEKIETVLATIEAGQRLTVGQVKSLVKEGEEARSEKKIAIGGLVGLRRAGEAKLKDELALFSELGKRLLKAVEPAAELLAKDKHVSKKALADKIEVDAHKAAGLLRSVIFPRQVDASQADNRGTEDALDGTWAGAPALLGRLGDLPRWPGRSEFPVWVTDSVLPMLRFVVHGDPLPNNREMARLPQAANAVEGVEFNGRLSLKGVPSLADVPEEDDQDHAAGPIAMVPVLSRVESQDPANTRTSKETPARV